MRVSFTTTSETEGLKNFKIKIHDCKSDTSKSCNCKVLELKQNIKYLGIIIDSKITWKDHVSYLVKRMRRVLYSLLKLRGLLGVDTLRIVYFALFQSIIDYGIAVYGGASESTIKPLIKTQRYAIKLILKLPKRYPSAELCDLLQVPDFSWLYERDLLGIRPLFVDKIESITSTYGTRNSLLEPFKIPFLRLELVKRGPRHNLLMILNKTEKEKLTKC